MREKRKRPRVAKMNSNAVVYVYVKNRARAKIDEALKIFLQDRGEGEIPSERGARAHAPNGDKYRLRIQNED